MSNAADHQLAIVIPAFKPDFLARALASVARQTDQRFNLYLCDDASPAPIEQIARSALGARPFVFKRFENNLGGKSLPQHWDRCVAESREPWIWLFSDDDLMEPNCVAAFYGFLETDEPTADIVRLAGWGVDGADRITGPNAFEPDRETWLEYAYGHLMGWRRLFMQQLLFRRSAYERAGKFLDLPLAFATDDAALIMLARQKPVRQIAGAKVFWRCSHANITPSRSLRLQAEKLRATAMFLDWLREQLRSPRDHLFENDEAAFLRAMDRFLVEHIFNYGASAAVANWRLLTRTRGWIGGSRVALAKYIAVAAVNDSISLLARAAHRLSGRTGN